MSMKSRLIEIASIGIVFAFASAAFAQNYGAGSAPGGAPTAGSEGSLGAGTAGATPGGAAGNVGGAGGTATTTFTTDTVSTTNPFGTINVGQAGTTTESIRTWAQGRSASERAELQGRCNVITTEANSSRYPAQAVSFCRNFMTASNANPSGTTGGTTTR